MILAILLQKWGLSDKFVTPPYDLWVKIWSPIRFMDQKLGGEAARPTPSYDLWTKILAPIRFMDQNSER